MGGRRAAKRRAGTRVWLYATDWQGELPVDGDFLRTSTGRCYQIEFVRKAQEGAKRKATFRCRVLEDDAVQLGEPGVFGWEWNRR